MRSHHFVTSGDWQTFIHSSSPRNTQSNPILSHVAEKSKQKKRPRKHKNQINLDRDLAQERRIEKGGGAQNFLEDFVLPTPAHPPPAQGFLSSQPAPQPHHHNYHQTKPNQTNLASSINRLTDPKIKEKTVTGWWRTIKNTRGETNNRLKNNQI